MKFVSYNIQYGTGKDGRIDLDRIAAEIGDADVIALQEVDRFNSETQMSDQVAELAELFPSHYYAYGPGVDIDASFHDASGKLNNRRRQFRNMLLSKTPIISSRNHLLPKYGMNTLMALQRSAPEGVIECELGPSDTVMEPLLQEIMTKYVIFIFLINTRITLYLFCE